MCSLSFPNSASSAVQMGLCFPQCSAVSTYFPIMPGKRLHSIQSFASEGLSPKMQGMGKHIFPPACCNVNYSSQCTLQCRLHVPQCPCSGDTKGDRQGCKICCPGVSVKHLWLAGEPPHLPGRACVQGPLTWIQVRVGVTDSPAQAAPRYYSSAASIVQPNSCLVSKGDLLRNWDIGPLATQPQELMSSEG